MQLRLAPGLPGAAAVDLAVAYQFQGERVAAGVPERRLALRLAKLARADRFRPSEGEIFLWHPERGPVRRWLVVGLGERDLWDAERLRRTCARLVARARRLGARRLDVPLLEPGRGRADAGRAVRLMAAALVASAQRFDKYRSRPPRADSPAVVTLRCGGTPLAGLRSALRIGEAEARALTLARDLVNEPGGSLSPAALAARAREVARRAGLGCRILDERALRRRKMGAILGVGMGSGAPPRLVHLIYRPRRGARRRVALVGKGITFDSGGLSLKPAASMEDMKSDKAGASAVLGVMSVVAELGLPLEVHGILAAAENMPGGRALRPGDVLRTCSGKTVEVLNTDAEGRLVLADALTYAQDLKVDEVVDVATLTGACMVALGSQTAGVMGNSRPLVERLKRAAAEAGEKIWELPLVADYKEQLRSGIADLRNTGDRYGGAIIAGLFLEHFIRKRQAWAHLDIAGPAFAGKGREEAQKGATGAPVPTLLRYLELTAREGRRGAR
jgi:leucyl aminopeptidase